MKPYFSNSFVKSLLCSFNPKFPVSNSHCISGKDIWFFSNFACVENTLTNFTSGITHNIKCLKKKYKM